MMRKILAATIGAALLTTTSVFAADSGAPLPAGKPAGLHKAQDDDDNTLLYVLGGAALIAVIAVAASSGGSNNNGGTTTGTATS